MTPRERANYLASMKQIPSQDKIGFSSSNIENYLQLH
jgi:hypothetical protein